MRIADTPDRIGQAEDVIWEARGDDAFLSSHLVLSADPNNDFISRTIANCLYRRGRMVEEWVVRDCAGHRPAARRRPRRARSAQGLRRLQRAA